MTLTRSCPAGKTARCDGSTFVRRRAALKRTAKMYGDSCGIFRFIAVQIILTLKLCLLFLNGQILIKISPELLGFYFRIS